jgi:hypothetical protein
MDCGLHQTPALVPVFRRNRAESTVWWTGGDHDGLQRIIQK